MRESFALTTPPWAQLVKKLGPPRVGKLPSLKLECAVKALSSKLLSSKLSLQAVQAQSLKTLNSLIN